MPDTTTGATTDGPDATGEATPDSTLDALRAAVAAGVAVVEPVRQRHPEPPTPQQHPEPPTRQRHPDLPVRYQVTPGDTGEAAAVLRAAAAHDLAVVAAGGMTRQDWGYPPRRVDLLVRTGRLTGVVEHAAGDLIVVVRAGTPLPELRAELAGAGQQLALDSPVPEDATDHHSGGTVGGVVAVNASGPRRMLYGTARDLLIGVTVVRPDGVLAKAGGKVVKNVAGYDLGKLFTGSYGTLGLITECAFRLHPLPAASAHVRRTVADPAEAGRLVAALLRARLVPTAVEVDAPADGPLELVVLLEGTVAGVRDRAVAARRLLGDDATVDGPPPSWWSRYPWRTGDTGLKLTAALSRVPHLLATAGELARQHRVPVPVRGSVGTGVLYAGLPQQVDPDEVALIVEKLRTASAEAGGHAVALTAPAPVRQRLDLWGPVAGLDLMRRVKEQFDPTARFAPGRFVGGI